MTSLYLCYQSLLEPLTQTQVVAYLEGLARAGYRIVLLTFEPQSLDSVETEAWQRYLASKGIIWYWLRYHKSPTVPATAWDIGMGILKGLDLIRKYRVRLLHARSHVPGLMGLILKRLTGTKLLFDLRGFMAEEYVDGGIWFAGGLLFRLTKRVERAVVQAADAVVVLTAAARDLLAHWYPAELANKHVEVIPCCADLRRSLGPGVSAVRWPSSVALAYAGKLGGWYPTREMVEFVAAARQMISNVRFQVWTQSDPTDLQRLAAAGGLADCLQVGRVAPERLPAELARADVGLCLYRRTLSGAACSPTKVGEYLAAGLPVVCSSGIGDMDALLSSGGPAGCGPVGVLVHEFSAVGYRAAVEQLLRLLDDPLTPDRCRAVAADFFDLEQVGWKRYRCLYDRLLGRPNET